MNKSELRNRYKAQRLALNSDELEMLNAAILTNLKTLDWSKYTYLHVYLSLKEFNEPDTNAFIDWIKNYYPHIKLVVSKTNFKTLEMTNYLLDQHTVLEISRYGIPEPKNGIIVNEKFIDVVLVPLLVFDKIGNRIGYGKGFYDRFLDKCKHDVKTIGISFFEPLEVPIDVDPWDYKLNKCITPQKIYDFNLK